MVEVAAGSQYRKSVVGEFFLGKHYRFLWTTPVKVKVLDLKTEGLRITKRGGGMQTTSFTLEDSSGQAYSLRSLDKDPVSVIPTVLWRTVLGLFIRDQIACSAAKLFDRLGAKLGLLDVQLRLRRSRR